VDGFSQRGKVAVLVAEPGMRLHYYVTRTNPLMMTIRNSRGELTMLTGKSKMNKQLQIKWLLEID
jgi:hypothetical protein